MSEIPVKVRDRRTCQSSGWKVTNEGLEIEIRVLAPHTSFECDNLDDLKSLHAAITKFIELEEAEGVQS